MPLILYTLYLILYAVYTVYLLQEEQAVSWLFGRKGGFEQAIVKGHVEADAIECDDADAQPEYTYTASGVLFFAAAGLGGEGKALGAIAAGDHVPAGVVSLPLYLMRSIKCSV